MRDVILSLGCSYTTAGFVSSQSSLKDAPASVKGPWKMWPQIFTERLSERDQFKYTLINTGKSGSGMDFAGEKFFENWIKYKDRLKVVLWGGTGYFRFQSLHNGNINIQLQHFSDDKLGNDRSYFAFFKKGELGYIEALASRTKDDALYLRQVKINHERLVCIKDLCESNDVHFIYYPLLAPFAGGTYSKFGGREHGITRGETMNYLYEGSPKAWESISKDRNFIGISSFGFAWDNWQHLFRNYKNHLINHNKEYPTTDSHPNSEGQKLIANEFWKHYEKHFLKKEKTNVR